MFIKIWIEMIEIKNFTKKYNKTFTAVDDLSLTIEDGDIYAFIGHNGAGKTTTIEIMATFCFIPCE